MTIARVYPKSGNGRSYTFLADHVAYSGDDCLIWPYCIIPSGYGTLGFARKTYRAHRLMCVLVYGDAPTLEHDAAHSCGNRACVNPKHLSWKTSRDNHLDQRMHGTSVTTRRGRRGHLTKVQVAEIRTKAGSVTNTSLAQEYGVSLDTIRRAINGDTYSGKPGELRLFTYAGRTMCLTDWAREAGIHRKILKRRLASMPFEEAIGCTPQP